MIAPAPRSQPVEGGEELPPPSPSALLGDIITGAMVKGRWIAGLSRGMTALDGGRDEEGNKGAPPEGFYDEDYDDVTEDGPEVDRSAVPVPADVAEDYLDQLRFVGGRWLQPARWEDYDIGETNGWLEGLAHPHGQLSQVKARVEALEATNASLLAALEALTDWGCEHTSPRDANSPHMLLIAARTAITAAKGAR